jgi:hypothetical protein
LSTDDGMAFVNTIKAAYANNSRSQGFIYQFEVETVMRTITKFNTTCNDHHLPVAYFSLRGGFLVYNVEFAVKKCIDYDLFNDIGIPSDGFMYITRDSLNTAFDFVFYERRKIFIMLALSALLLLQLMIVIICIVFLF